MAGAVATLFVGAGFDHFEKLVGIDTSLFPPELTL